MIENEIVQDISKIVGSYGLDKKDLIKIYDYFIDTLKEKDYRLYLKRAELYEDLQEYKRAIREYRFAINSRKDANFVDGEISYAHHKIACLYYELGNSDKAIKEAKLAVEVNSVGFVFDSFDYAFDYNKNSAKGDLAEIYYKTGNYDKAEDIMDEDNFGIGFIDSDRVLLIKILIAKRDYKKAKKQIDKLKETSNKYVLLAEIEKLKGNTDKALSYYKKAKEVKLDFGEYDEKYINEQIGSYYESIGDFDETIKYYKEIFDYSWNGTLLADFYFKNKDYKNAIIYYLETLNQERYDKNKDYLHYKLGLSYIELNDKKQAQFYFKKANWLKPNDEYEELVKKYSTPEELEREKAIREMRLHHSTQQREIRHIIRNIVDLLLEEYDEIPQEIEEYLEKLAGCTNTNEIIDDKWISDTINDFCLYLHKKFQLSNNKLNQLLNELKEVPLYKLLH